MKNLKLWQKMTLGFGLVILLMIAGGAVSIKTAISLSGLTEKLYRHPLAVGTSIRDIQTQMVAIHRSMKDVAMAETLGQLEEYQRKVNRNVQNALEGFTVLDDRFLGDKKEINEAKQLFMDWGAIRDRVIEQRIIQLKNNADQIIRTEELPHVEKLSLALEDLIDFTNEKAKEFYDKSRNQNAETAENNLVEKFYNHPFTVATTAIEVESHVNKILSLMKDITASRTPEEVRRVSAMIDEILPEITNDFSLISSRFLGDPKKINAAQQLFNEWEPIRKKVLQTRLAYVTANPKEITVNEGAPLLAKLIDELDQIKLFADKKAVEFNVNAQRQSRHSSLVLIVIFTIATIMGLIAAIWVTRNIVVPTKALMGVAEKVASGDLTQTLNDERKDEIGDLSRSIDTMSLNLREMFKDIVAGTATLNEASGGLAGVSEQIHTNSENTAQKANNVAAAAEEMGANMNSVAASIDQTTSNILMIVSAVEEMSSTINEIVNNTSKGSQTTEKAVKDAEGVSRKVGTLNSASREINKVTEAIAEISEQTNLLALNATIEAARAGEAGKGFAVVAGEIKALAQQTAEATREINDKITGVQMSTEESITAIESIVGVINEINEIVTTVASAIEEQSSTTMEISKNVNHASEGIKEVNSSVSQTVAVTEHVAQDIAEVSKAATDMNRNSSQISQRADELEDLSQKLNLMVKRFKI